MPDLVLEVFVKKAVVQVARKYLGWRSAEAPEKNTLIYESDHLINRCPLDLRAVIDLRLRELKEKPFDELARLPSCCGEETKVGNKEVTVTVWKDEIASDNLRIVVQAYRHHFLGIGTIDAKGFHIDRSGILTDVEEPEIFEFI